MPEKVVAEPGVHPDLAAQMALYEVPRIITTRGHIHTAHCYTGSNCTLIVGADGCVLVDTLSGELRATRPPPPSARSPTFRSGP